RSSPPFEERTVEPVPEEVEPEPSRPRAAVVQRDLDAEIRHDVLPGREGDLELGEEAPLRRTAPLEGARAEEFDHRGPDPAEPAFGEAPPECGAPEPRTVRPVRVERELDAALELEEGVLGKDLAEGDEGLEDRRPRAEPVVAVPGREDELAGGAQDRAAGEAVKERAFHADGDVAQPEAPPGRLPALDTERDREFDLVPRPEPLLVDELVQDGTRALQGDVRGEDGLVFGVRLLGPQRSGQVQ